MKRQTKLLQIWNPPGHQRKFGIEASGSGSGDDVCFFAGFQK